MINEFRKERDSIWVQVRNKKETKWIQLDELGLNLAKELQGEWRLLQTNNSHQFYVVASTDTKRFLHRSIMNAQLGERIYFQTEDYADLRSSNLGRTYRVSEWYKEIRKKQYQSMSEQGLNNLREGIRTNRYSKEWSDKLSEKKKGAQNKKAKLSVSDVQTIRHLYHQEGHTQGYLAQHYEVARTTIADIVNFRTWNDLTLQEYDEKEMIPVQKQDINPQFHQFTIDDIPMDEFVFEWHSIRNIEYILIRKIANDQLYMEIRDTNKEFLYSFEVRFPSVLHPQHIYNYVVTHRKPYRYLTRHVIHAYMTRINDYLWSPTTTKNTL